jgi:hypothetical protein
MHRVEASYIRRALAGNDGPSWGEVTGNHPPRINYGFVEVDQRRRLAPSDSVLAWLFLAGLEGLLGDRTCGLLDAAEALVAQLVLGSAESLLGERGRDARAKREDVPQVDRVGRDLGLTRDRGTAGAGDDLYWVKDLDTFVGLTYSEQVSAIDNLNTIQFGGLMDWHMATEAEMIHTLLNSSFGSTGQPTPTGLYSPEEIASVFGDPTEETLCDGFTCKAWKGRYDLVLPNFPAGGHFEVVITFDPRRTDKYRGGRVGVADREVFPGAWAVSTGPPIPEPTAALVFGLGVLLVGAAYRTLNTSP